MTTPDASIWLITSGAYVGQELAAEFGKLPPAFLPVGTKRLFEYQVGHLGSGGPIYLTLPETFGVPPRDMARLAELGVTVLAVPDGLSLGESVVFALNLISGPDTALRILHGDTLIEPVPTDGLDELGVATGGEGYSWAEAKLEGGHVAGLETIAAGAPTDRGLPVLCGYFAFGSSAALVRAITRARGDFIKGIAAYAADKPLSAVPVTKWFDFGHLQTYFRSRRVVATARAFNSLRIDGRVARKSSADGAKMRAEAEWLANVPPNVRIYTARLIDFGSDDNLVFYETEYEYLPTLSELFVFGTLSRLAWTRILRSCQDYLDLCSKCTDAAPVGEALRALVLTKTAARLAQFARETGFDIEAMVRYDGRPLPSLMQIAEDLERYIDLETGRQQSVMHGDFCFSNILYDSRVQRIRVIDPRGYVTEGGTSIYGDLRYDLAKLSHSIVGRYDQIIAGRYVMHGNDGHHFSIEFEPSLHHAWLEEAMEGFVVDGVAARSLDVRAVTISLFLSMLPLHADRPDRQRAFIANALRLYAELEVARG